MQAVGGISFIVVGAMGLHYWLSFYTNYGYNNISFNGYDPDPYNGDRRGVSYFLKFQKPKNF